MLSDYCGAPAKRMRTLHNQQLIEEQGYTHACAAHMEDTGGQRPTPDCTGTPGHAQHWASEDEEEHSPDQDYVSLSFVTGIMSSDRNVLPVLSSDAQRQQRRVSWDVTTETSPSHLKLRSLPRKQPVESEDYSVINNTDLLGYQRNDRAESGHQRSGINESRYQRQRSKRSSCDSSGSGSSRSMSSVSSVFSDSDLLSYDAGCGEAPLVIHGGEAPLVIHGGEAPLLIHGLQSDPYSPTALSSAFTIQSAFSIEDSPLTGHTSVSLPKTNNTADLWPIHSAIDEEKIQQNSQNCDILNDGTLTGFSGMYERCNSEDLCISARPPLSREPSGSAPATPGFHSNTPTLPSNSSLTSLPDLQYNEDGTCTLDISAFRMMPSVDTLSPCPDQSSETSEETAYSRDNVQCTEQLEFRAMTGYCDTEKGQVRPSDTMMRHSLTETPEPDCSQLTGGGDTALSTTESSVTTAPITMAPPPPCNAGESCLFEQYMEGGEGAGGLGTGMFDLDALSLHLEQCSRCDKACRLLHGHTPGSEQGAEHDMALLTPHCVVDNVDIFSHSNARLSHSNTLDYCDGQMKTGKGCEKVDNWNEVTDWDRTSGDSWDIEQEAGLDMKVKEFVDSVIAFDSNNSAVTRLQAVKFLMARKFDVERAVHLYFQHQLVRKTENISEVDPTQTDVKRELLTEKFTVLPSRDSSGAAIALFTARFHQPNRTSHEATLKALVFQLDAALESLETQRNGLIFVYDMTQSKYINFDYDLSIKILNMLKGAYPARLKKVLIVTAPLWFKAPFRILRLFVKEKLRDRVYTINSAQLHKHIASSALPQRLGGTMEVKHKDWIGKCLQVHWGKNTQIDNDVAAYFENIDNSLLPDLSIYSLSSSVSTPASSPEGSLGGFHSSEVESEGSRGTVSEKHNHESREKELGDLNDMDITENSNSVTNSAHAHRHSLTESSCDRLSEFDRDDISTTSSSKISTSLNDVKSIPCKRGSDTSPSEVVPGEHSGPALPRKKKAHSSSTSSSGSSGSRRHTDSVHGPEPGGYSVKELMEMTRIKGRAGLMREYQKIKDTPPRGHFTVSKSRQNLPKNRYTDVLCFDHSRVQLTLEEDDPHSDYVNANYVDGYKHKGAYISTQGPLPRTFPDFWRMIWEQGVLLVVMTTRTVERSRIKCGHYWPSEEGTEEEYGDFFVTNTGIDRRDSYIVTTLLLQNGKSGETREVTHFQFISWPDYGVPHSADAFLTFMHDVRRTQQQRTRQLGDTWAGHPEGPPIAIHCSAGIGRTGTFITMDILTRRLADISTVEVKATVERIRSQRAYSIQMPDQYVFIHLALLEHAQNAGLLETINLDGFEDSSSSSDD